MSELDNSLAYLFQKAAEQNPENEISGIIQEVKVDDQPVQYTAKQIRGMRFQVGSLRNRLDNFIEAHLLQEREMVSSARADLNQRIKIITNTNEEKQREESDIRNNPRKYLDLVASEWYGIRIEGTKNISGLDKITQYTHILDSELVEREDRDQLITRFMNRLHLLDGNKILYNHTLRILQQPNHPIKDYLRSQEGNWTLTTTSVQILEVWLDMYGYSSERANELGNFIEEFMNSLDESVQYIDNSLFKTIIIAWYASRKLVTG